MKDRQCRLEDVEPASSGAEASSAASRSPRREPGEKQWVCQLNSDVNLRLCLPHVPRGMYMAIWYFSYHIDSDYTAASVKVQRYNLSMGRALNPTMFMARVSDPSQPFISGDLNTFLTPRVTAQMVIPYPQTQETKDKYEMAVRYPPDGRVTEGRDGGVLNVEWDDGIVFLAKLVSPRSFEGRLCFHGVQLMYLTPEAVQAAESEAAGSGQSQTLPKPPEVR
jgi:hypothetical protein